jgi:hypothetical protein
MYLMDVWKIGLTKEGKWAKPTSLLLQIQNLDAIALWKLH